MGAKPPLVLNVFVGFPSYGGNGGISSEVPDIREWWAETLLEMKADPRVGEIITKTIADTPITMVRNRFVTLARQEGAHLLMMVDSDQSPGKHKGEPWFKPFWKTAFDEIYSHYQRGPLVVGAPYCGPPGAENVYVFQFDNYGVHGGETRVSLEQYTRAEAAKMSGVGEVAALPTGLILFDMRIFELCEPCSLSRDKIVKALINGELTENQALAALRDGWFYYEWRDQYCDQKASTEDVASTRDMMFMCLAKLGYNPLRCAWDSWIGHYKPWNVGRPTQHSVQDIAADFRRAVLEDSDRDEVLMDFRHMWADELKNPNIVIDLPSGFPREVLDMVPDKHRIHLSTRDVFGHESATFLHMTPMVHLKALRELVRTESRLKGRKLRVIEVGSWLGDSAIAMAPYCDQILCIDNWGGSDSDWTKALRQSIGSIEVVQKMFEFNTRNFDNIKSITGLSVDVANELNGQFDKADVIFIDADHRYESVKSDIDAWYPHLAEDGVMIGHDYLTRNWPGVKRAAHERFGEHVKGYAVFQDHGGFWLVRNEEVLHAATA